MCCCKKGSCTCLVKWVPPLFQYSAFRNTVSGFYTISTAGMYGYTILRFTNFLIQAIDRIANTHLDDSGKKDIQAICDGMLYPLLVCFIVANWKTYNRMGENVAEKYKTKMKAEQKLLEEPLIIQTVAVEDSESEEQEQKTCSENLKDCFSYSNLKNGAALGKGLFVWVGLVLFISTFTENPYLSFFLPLATLPFNILSQFFLFNSDSEEEKPNSSPSFRM